MAENKMTIKKEKEITIDLSKDFKKMLRRNDRFFKALSE